jgi:signal transduction histidine kinase
VSEAAAKQRGFSRRVARVVLIVLTLGTLAYVVIVGAVFHQKSVVIKRQLVMIGLRMARVSAEAGALSDEHLTAEFGDLPQFALVLYDENGRAMARSQRNVDVIDPLPAETRQAASAAPGQPIFPRTFLIVTDNIGVMALRNDAGPVRYVGLFDRWATNHVVLGVVEALGGGLLGSILVFGIATWFLGRKLREGLRHAELVVHKMARGQLDIRLPSYGDDDIGKLAGNFNRMADTLANHIDQLQHERDMRRRSFADWTHEIATPLSSVLGYLESLQMSDIETAIKPRYIATAYEQALALKALTEDLRTLSQIDFDGLEIEREPINVAVLVEYEVEAFRGPVEGKGIRLVFSSKGRACGMGDRRRLAQVVRILLSNALRYARSTIEVDVRVNANKRVLIQVSDDGPGIAPEHMNKLGDLFFRPDASRNRRTGGRGLGLSIAKGIMAAHGGDMVIESTIDEGTSITVDVEFTPEKVTDVRDLPNLDFDG